MRRGESLAQSALPQRLESDVEGWNDRINEKFVAEYESNMAHIIRDMRKEHSAPVPPFVIAETYYLIAEAKGEAMERLITVK